MENVLATALMVVLVAGAPGFFLAALWRTSVQEALNNLVDAGLAAPLREALADREHVATIKDLVGNLCFVGPAAGAIFGYAGESLQAYLVGALLALVASLVLIWLSRLSAALDKEVEALAHRRTAGAVRSIMRSELSAAARVRPTSPPRRRVGKAVRGCCCGCNFNCNANISGSLKTSRRASRMRGSNK